MFGMFVLVFVVAMAVGALTSAFMKKFRQTRFGLAELQEASELKQERGKTMTKGDVENLLLAATVMHIPVTVQEEADLTRQMMFRRVNACHGAIESARKGAEATIAAQQAAIDKAEQSARAKIEKIEAKKRAETSRAEDRIGQVSSMFLDTTQDLEAQIQKNLDRVKKVGELAALLEP